MEPANQLRRRWIWAGLFCLGVAWVSRVASFWIVYAEDRERILQPDSATYEGPALALLETARFAAGPEPDAGPEVSRTPGYPLFIAAVYGLFGASHRALILVQIVVSVLTMLLVWRAVSRIWDERAGLIALVIMTLDPAAFLYSQLYLSETLFAFALSASAVAGAELMRREKPSLGLAIATGLMIAFTTHIRPITYYLVFPAAIATAVVFWNRGAGWRRIVLLITAMLAPWVALVPTWQMRNRQAIGISVFSTIQDYNLLFYRGAAVKAVSEGISLDEAQIKLREEFETGEALPPGERAVLQRREGLELLRRHPGAAIRVHLRGAAKLVLGPAWSGLRRLYGAERLSAGPVTELRQNPFGEWFQKWVLGNPTALLGPAIEGAWLLAVYFGVAAALVFLARNREKISVHVVLLGILLYMFALSSGPEAYVRFRAPLMPLISIYAALGYLWLWKRKTSRNADSDRPTVQ